ncbi:MAG: hypothetical protein ACRC2B_03875 [Rubrivivax sp.]
MVDDEADQRRVDPRAMTNVTDPHGDALDLSGEEGVLTSAASAGDIAALPVGQTMPDHQPQTSVSSVVGWQARRAGDCSPSKAPATVLVRNGCLQGKRCPLLRARRLDAHGLP